MLGTAPMPEKSVAMLHCEVADSGLLKIDRIGAGVGVIIYDRAHHIGAGFHVLAAYSSDSKPQNPFMFANTAVPQVFTEISEKGGRAPFSVACRRRSLSGRENRTEYRPTHHRGCQGGFEKGRSGDHARTDG